MIRGARNVSRLPRVDAIKGYDVCVSAERECATYLVFRVSQDLYLFDTRFVSFYNQLGHTERTGRVEVYVAHDVERKYSKKGIAPPRLLNIRD